MGAESVAKFPTKRSAFILARLALAKSHRVGRDELTQQLWPDDFLDITRVRLRQELTRLKQSIGDLGAHLRADRQVVEIDHGCLTTDVQMFEDHISASDAAADDADRTRLLAEAVQLLHGPFMAGYQEPWVLATRRAYEEKARRAWLRLAESYAAQANDDEALLATFNAVRHAPMDVEANTSLIRRLLDQGQAAQARQAFYDFDAMMFRELGQHAPFSLKELIPSAADVPAPPPQTAKTTPRRPGPLYGRDNQVAAILDALSHPGARVVVVGAIGVGKTHLAREVAWQFAQAWPEMPVQFGGARFEGEMVPVKDGLLIIEAHQAATDLRRASENGWRVLVESRARPDLDGFAEVVLPRLPLPSEEIPPAELAANPAVQILLSRVPEQARALTAERELAELARRSGGLPGTLKFFADRLIIQPPSQIIRSFDDALSEFLNTEIAAGETFRLALGRLVADVPEPVRNVLMRLLPLDGASLELAEALAAPYEPAGAWRALERQSLILIEDDGEHLRYRVPPEIRYCLSSTMQPDDRRRSEAETWSRVAEWAFAASRKSGGPVEDFFFSRIQAELPNLLNGLRWAVDHAPKTAGLLVAGLWRTVCARGNPSAVAELIRRGAIAGAAELPPNVAGEVWTGAGILLSLSGLLPSSAEAFESAIRVYEESGDGDGKAWSMLNYGSHVLNDVDPPRAADLALQASALTSRSEDRQIALVQYAWGLAARGENADAVRIGEEVFADRLKRPGTITQARAYGDLADVYIRVGRPEAARPLLEESVRRLRDAGIQDFLCQTLILLAGISLEFDETQLLLDEARALATALGSYRESLAVALASMAYASVRRDPAKTVVAAEEVMRFTQQSQSPAELHRSLQSLASALDKFDRTEFANAARSASGQTPEGPLHEGWKALLSSDSHATVCALAAAMAKEALRP